MRFPTITSPKPVVEHLTAYIYAGALLALALYIIKTNDMNAVSPFSFMGMLFWAGVIFLQVAGIILWVWSLLYGAKQLSEMVASAYSERGAGVLPVLAFVGYCLFAGSLSFIIFVFSALQSNLIS